ncbi:MAG: Fur family transcriptional regulator [Candidatus Nanopelagicales bacterium]
MNWDNKLRQLGYRITPQRQVVLEAIGELKHATPEQILATVNKKMSGINLSTIYRTLEVLEKVGLVSHSHLGHGAPTYHSVEEETHIHLVCANCERVQSISADIMEYTVRALRADRAFEVDVSHVTFHGLCDKCSKK